MRSAKIAGALLLLVLPAAQAQAGLHLGMKLACKRYGEAWNSGNASALWGAATGDFAEVWNRMPDAEFSDLPRGGKGKVLSSSKGRGAGTVTVATSHGVMTFAIVGKGFQWRVADIYRPGDDGSIVSVKNYVDVSLTAREFMVDLKEVGGTAFHDSITDRFRVAFQQLADDDLNRVRNFLPNIRRTDKPRVILDDERATVRVAIPGQTERDTITFHMVHEAGWRVDDYSIDSSAVQIASFRQALPIIASSSAFGEFAENPQGIDPRQFATGELRATLEWARTAQPFPLPAPGVRKQFVVRGAGNAVEIQFADRAIRLMAAADADRRLSKVEVRVGESWADLCGLLAVQRNVRSLTFAGAKSTNAGGNGAVAQLTTAQEPVVVAAATTPAPRPAPIIDPAVIPVAAPAEAASTSSEAPAIDAAQADESSETCNCKRCRKQSRRFSRRGR